MEALRSNLEIAKSGLAPNPSFHLPKCFPSASASTFALVIEDALAVLQEFKPAVVWLFAAKAISNYENSASQIRAASPGSKIWIQCGGITAALEICSVAKPDVLVMQGADAGGHGFEKGAGIIFLLPETSDTLS
jgi:nitronate monooxygenase